MPIKAPEMRFVLGIVWDGSKSKAMFLYKTTGKREGLRRRKTWRLRSGGLQSRKAMTMKENGGETSFPEPAREQSLPTGVSLSSSWNWEMTNGYWFSSAGLGKLQQSQQANIVGQYSWVAQIPSPQLWLSAHHRDDLACCSLGPWFPYVEKWCQVPSKFWMETRFAWFCHVLDVPVHQMNVPWPVV